MIEYRAGHYGVNFNLNEEDKNYLLGKFKEINFPFGVIEKGEKYGYPYLALVHFSESDFWRAFNEFSEVYIRLDTAMGKSNPSLESTKIGFYPNYTDGGVATDQTDLFFSGIGKALEEEGVTGVNITLDDIWDYIYNEMYICYVVSQNADGNFYAETDSKFSDVDFVEAFGATDLANLGLDSIFKRCMSLISYE